MLADRGRVCIRGFVEAGDGLECIRLHIMVRQIVLLILLIGYCPFVPTEFGKKLMQACFAFCMALTTYVSFVPSWR
jgi:hypothetical protein